MFFYFEEADEAGLRAELFAPEPLLLLAELFDAPAFPVTAFCAFAADADLVSPDLLPPDLLAIGVLAASLAPAVFLGAAVLAAVPVLVAPDDADFDEEVLLPPPAEPLEALEPPVLFPVAVLDVLPELFTDPAVLLVELPELLVEPPELFAEEAALLVELPELFDEAAEEPVLFAAVALEVPAADFDAETLAGAFDALASDLEPATASITDAAAPLTAPEAAPARTSPIASLVLS